MSWRGSSKQPLLNERIDIDRSKVARRAQTDLAAKNWDQMVKLLFLTDRNQGRRDELVRLLGERTRSKPENRGASYNTDQMQYILLLMVILTIAESRSEIMYQENFSDRCDAISAAHGLTDDQYWVEKTVPDEWRILVSEFKHRSIQILIETLREYNLGDIADLVEQKGVEQLLDIVRSVESQFLNMLRDASSWMREMTVMRRGSFPESIQGKKD